MKALSPLLLSVDSGVGSSASSTASSTSPRCLPTEDTAEDAVVDTDSLHTSPLTSAPASPRTSPQDSPQASPKHQSGPPPHPVEAERPDPEPDPAPDPEEAEPDPEAETEALLHPEEEQRDSPDSERCRQAADDDQKSDESDIERNFRFLLESLGFTCDPREVTLVSSRPNPSRPHAVTHVLQLKPQPPQPLAGPGDPVQCDQPLKAARLGLTQSCVGAQVLRRVGRRPGQGQGPPGGPSAPPGSVACPFAAPLAGEGAVAAGGPGPGPGGGPGALKRTASGPASSASTASSASLRQRGIRPHQRNLLSLQQLRHIKNLVDQAVSEQKIFSICGAFPSVREALRNRGWLEKKWVANECPRERPGDREREREKENKDRDTVDKDKENRDGEKEEKKEKVEVKDRIKSEESMLSLLDSLAGEELNEKSVVTRLLRGVPANFIWTVKFDGIDWKRLKKRQIINRFPKAFFTTKIGLSTFLRQMHWFSEEGVSLTRFPRCYNICQPDDMEAFVDDFRLTACLNTLKWLVETVDRGGATAAQSPQGKVPKMAIEFALTRCREFLIEHSNEDLDRAAPPTVFAHQWDQFLSWTYLMHRDDAALNAVASEPTITALYSESCWVLERVAPLWPQLALDGRLNVWIMKPGAKSRGRGIHLLNRLDLLTAQVSSTHLRDARYVAQKYIERPLLICGTKFDIRQWFLVTSVYPMTIWMYRESYLRFCSQSFSLSNMHESVHLCNNAVQAKYTNGKRDPALPDENMWDCYTFQTYLRAMGRADLWDSVIYPGMRQGIVGSLLASQEHMDRRGDCFELFGADFMLTEDFVPWLIEINSCPCMAPSTSVTARMCAQCLEDVIKVVVDRREDRNADTGMFELVYRQSIPPPPPYLGMSLSVRGRKIPSAGAAALRRRKTASQSEPEVDTASAASRWRRPGPDASVESRHASPATLPAVPSHPAASAPGPPHSHATPRRQTLEPGRAQTGLAAVGTQLSRVARCASTLNRRRRHRQLHPSTALPLAHRPRRHASPASAVAPTPTPLLAVGLSLRPQPAPPQPQPQPPNQ